jgi:O-antigen/teichoic acid export membrane protein
VQYGNNLLSSSAAMLKNILGTAGSRILNALMSFGIVIITTNYLGAKGTGVIAMLMFAISLNQLFSSLLGGHSLIYFIPRTHLPTLYFISCLWAIISAVIGTAVLQLFHLIPEQNAWHVFFLSVILSFASSNTMVLLGKERITSYNVISVLQLAVLGAVLLFEVEVAGEHTAWAYILALYISFALYFVLGFLSVLKHLSFSVTSDIKGLIKTIFRYVSMVQLASIIQLLNYRLSYYIIQNWFGKAAVGRFDVGVKLSEGMWLVSKSLAMVQFVRIANMSDLDYSRLLTLRFLKATIIVTLSLLTVLLLMPGDLYTFVFGKEFGETRHVMFALAPGIMAVAMSMILSSFFSGNGKPQVNTIASAIGLATLLVAGFLLIPAFGIVGAGVAASVAYSATVIYQLYVFSHRHNFHVYELIPTKKDFIFIRNEVRLLMTKSYKAKENPTSS